MIQKQKNTCTGNIEPDIGFRFYYGGKFYRHFLCIKVQKFLKSIINEFDGATCEKYRSALNNEVYEFEFEMTGFANVFNPGQRIRVDITTSNFPQFDRNPNTGKAL